MLKPQLLLFSDLDGTFLSHQDYGYSQLQHLLPVIRRKQIPLIFCSSKTRAEVELLRRKIGNSHPFIVENGGAIYWRRGYFPKGAAPFERAGPYDCLKLGESREMLVQKLNQVKTETGIPIRSFADMNVQEIAELAGLSMAAARLAMAREYDEPFLILTEEKTAILQIVARIGDLGLSCSRGGRFWHILGNNDKGIACRWLLRKYWEKNESTIAVGLGDSPNDLAMLREVTIPILVKQADGTHNIQIKEALPNLVLAEGIGPDGWASAIQSVLSEFL